MHPRKGASTQPKRRRPQAQGRNYLRKAASNQVIKAASTHAHTSRARPQALQKNLYSPRLWGRELLTPTNTCYFLCFILFIYKLYCLTQRQ